VAAAEAAGGGISKVRDISYQGVAIVPLRYGACAGHGTCYTGEDLLLRYGACVGHGTCYTGDDLPVQFTMVYRGMQLGKLYIQCSETCTLSTS
jgi:hypothetical protein